MDKITRRIKSKIDKLLAKYKTIIYIYPKSSKVKSDEYDPYRDEGYTKTGHNPIGLKVYVRDASPEGLIVREIGLRASQIKELWIDKKYIDLIKNAEKITIDGDDYSVWSEAVGNRFQIYEKKGNLDLVEILVFRKEVE